MKSKFQSLIARAVILSFATTPVTSQKQADQSLADLFPLLVGVEILPQQTEQLVQLHQATRYPVEKILTNTQQSRFEAALSQSENFGKALYAMNLDAEQWLQLRRIFQSYCTKLANLLTPQQERQILQNLQTRWQQNRSENIKSKEIIEMLTRLFEIETA